MGRGDSNVMARRDDVLATLGVVKLANTRQIARLHFSDHLSPSKRASECLAELSIRKMVEGRLVKFGLPKVWRLTKMGREILQLSFTPVPFSHNPDHWQSIIDFYCALSDVEKPLIFLPEYRERCDDSLFAPDAFYVHQGRAFFLEMQLTQLTSKNWRKKWQVYEAYYASIATRNFQTATRPVKPSIIVVSNQMPETIGKPNDVDVQVVRRDYILGTNWGQNTD